MTFHGTNHEGMQSQNRSLILQILSDVETCTRTELAERTGLTPASISKIVAEMIENKIVIEGGNVAGKLKRRSVAISLNRHLCKVLAVKIARRSYSVAVFELGGRMIALIHKNITLSRAQPSLVMDDIMNEVHTCIREYPDIRAVGVAVPGPYLRREGKIAIMSEFSGWEHINVYDRISSELDIPVVTEHDANAGAFAEWRFGNNFGFGSRGTLVSLLASEGIGAGVITRGQIVRGSQGVAGEIGHMSINMNGPRCICGNYGCLEQYTSALAFAKMVIQDLKDHPESSLNQESIITATTVFDHMRSGDPFAIEEVKKVGRYLGIGMANIVYLYNPNEIIMTDIMTGGGDILLNAAKEVVAERTLPVLSENLVIRHTSLKYDTILMGAAALAEDYLLENPSRLYMKESPVNHM